jgi:hypothetical protein
MATASAVAAVTAAVAVELLVAGPTAILAATIAVISVVAIVAVFAMLARAMLLLAIFSLRPLLLVDSRLAGRFRDRRRRRWCSWGVLSRDGGYRRRRIVCVVASRGGSVWCVRVRLASRISGRTAVRARATATTVGTSAFGHATMFVMGVVFAVSRRNRPA